jgi:hypothetical protein
MVRLTGTVAERRDEELPLFAALDRGDAAADDVDVALLSGVAAPEPLR